jgi:hypothetical protein
MRWLTRRLNGDGGAIATIVVILLAGGVLLGMGALVVDVGRIYGEQRELQNGADAAALAVAQGCAVGAATCDTSTSGTALTYANGNAKDNAADVDCVRVGTRCPNIGGSYVYNCPAATGSHYVEVVTSTRTSSGSTLLPPSFARALAGNGAYPGKNVKSCARAAWASATSGAGLAMTISLCEWNAVTQNGNHFGPTPPDTPPAVLPPYDIKSASPNLNAYEVKLYLHTKGDGGASGMCKPAGMSGSDLPGGFGWLLDSNGKCTAPITNDTYTAETGTGVPKACKDALEAAWTNHPSVIYMPVYDGDPWGTGANGTYHLKGFAAFVVTGYYLPGLSAKSWLTGQSYCKGNDKCIYGYFTQALLPGGSDFGGTGGLPGVSVIKLVG